MANYSQIVETAKEVCPARYAKAVEISTNIKDFEDCFSPEEMELTGDELIYRILLAMKVYPDLQK